MNISLLINMKMPTIVGIFIFISRENVMLSWVEHEKKFYNLGARCFTDEVKDPYADLACARNFSTDRSNVVLLLIFFFLRASVVSYMVFVYSLFVSHLCFFLYLREAGIRDCCISLVYLLILFFWFCSNGPAPHQLTDTLNDILSEPIYFY